MPNRDRESGRPQSRRRLPASPSDGARSKCGTPTDMPVRCKGGTARTPPGTAWIHPSTPSRGTHPPRARIRPSLWCASGRGLHAHRGAAAGLSNVMAGKIVGPRSRKKHVPRGKPEGEVDRESEVALGPSTVHHQPSPLKPTCSAFMILAFFSLPALC
jgi:hypothetical protein